MNNECKIIRDLFPNYIENLLSDETKQFVEKHISNCKQCKEIIENIKEENIRYNDKQNIENQCEIDYLNRIRKKFLTLKGMVFLFIIIVIIIGLTFISKFTYSQYIIGKAYDKLQEIIDDDNYKLYVEEYYVDYENAEELFNYVTYYYKEGKYRQDENGKNITKNESYIFENKSYYGVIDSNERIEIYKDKREVINRTTNYRLMRKGLIIDNSYSYTREYGERRGLLFNLISKGGLSVRTEIYNGIECYVVSLKGDNVGYGEIWIEKDSMLVLRELSGSYGRNYREKKYKIEKGNVIDEDIMPPQLNDYTIKNEEELEVDASIVEYYNNR